MATALFKGGLSGGTEAGDGGLSHGQCLPVASLHPHCTDILPVLFLGGPRASPSPSGTCTPPMRPSMCSEGPWPGSFSRSVSVLAEGQMAVRVIPCCPRPTSAPQP